MASTFRPSTLFAIMALAVFPPLAPTLAQDHPAPPERHHALSLVGAPKFPADFKHFDWVNPDAAKGGTLRMGAIGGFDSLNPFTPMGEPAARLSTFMYDTLMADSPDEPSTEYCLVCEWVSFPADFTSATFRLRPEARFQDGAPITPEDVIFSLDALKKAHPRFTKYYENVVKAEKTGDHEVTFTFDKAGNRELPQIVGQLFVLPKHYWEGKGANGETRDLTKSTLEAPVGSGPYKIKSFETNRSLTYERVKDYWAKDLPVSVGQWNFDNIHFQYYRDVFPAREAFKSGQLDAWGEASASAWATQFNIPAVSEARMLKEAIPVERVVPMQAWAFNTRRAQVQDPRVRRAFNLAFNFERANKALFYGQYKRVESYFGGSELEAKGLPEGRELEILNTVKDQVPPEVFTTEWKNPVNNEPGDSRNHMQEAMRLLKEAGWTLNAEEAADPNCGVFCRTLRAVGLSSARTDQVLRNAKGGTLDAEILVDNEPSERIALPYAEDLKSLGIRAKVRRVDSAQYQRRVQNFDFDIITDIFQQSHSPGNEQREFWGSAAADMSGSQNTIGVKNPAIDKLIDAVVFAKSREDLVAATHALDRVLLWNNYVVPQWHYPFERLLTWNVFGRPAQLPKQGSSLFQVWWVDEAKKQALASARS